MVADFLPKAVSIGMLFYSFLFASARTSAVIDIIFAYKSRWVDGLLPNRFETYMQNVLI